MKKSGFAQFDGIWSSRHWSFLNHGNGWLMLMWTVWLVNVIILVYLNSISVVKHNMLMLTVCWGYKSLVCLVIHPSHFSVYKSLLMLCFSEHHTKLLGYLLRLDPTNGSKRLETMVALFGLVDWTLQWKALEWWYPLPTRQCPMDN